MKIIFLGIDTFRPETCDRLERVLAETDAWLVISSDWRIGKSLKYLKLELHEAGMPISCVSKIIGMTPEQQHFNSPEEASYDGRGGEISEWLDEIGFIMAKRLKEELAYAVVDDGSDLGPHQPYLIQTSSLTNEQADRLINMLNGVYGQAQADALEA